MVGLSADSISFNQCNEQFRQMDDHGKSGIPNTLDKSKYKEWKII
jgi:hypothetical protein